MNDVYMNGLFDKFVTVPNLIKLTKQIFIYLKEEPR